MDTLLIFEINNGIKNIKKEIVGKLKNIKNHTKIIKKIPFFVSFLTEK
jgi:hypothetical protein